MVSGSIDTEIQKYLPLLGNDEKQSILSVIKSFLNLKKEEAGTFNIAQYNKDIDDAMARIDKGEYTTHEDLEKEMESL